MGPFSVLTFCKFPERFMQICSFTNFLYKYIRCSCLLALPKIDVRLRLMTDTPNAFINNHRERFMRKPRYTLETLHQLWWMLEAHLKCWGRTYQRSAGIWLTSPSLLSVDENMNNFLVFYLRSTFNLCEYLPFGKKKNPSCIKLYHIM